MKRIIPLLILCLAAASCLKERDLVRYVDPTIGTGRGGHVVVGPCAPFGMVKPSPDVPGCNPGWGPLDKPIRGFSQLHVSGTGGSPKYGNVLIMPFTEGMYVHDHAARRLEETIQPGYYSTRLSDGDIRDFAHKANEIRVNIGLRPVGDPLALVAPRRYEDSGNDLWSVFNRTQENMMKGGLALAYDGTEKRKRLTRPIRNIVQNIDANRALWQMAEDFALNA